MEALPTLKLGHLKGIASKYSTEQESLQLKTEPLSVPSRISTKRPRQSYSQMTQAFETHQHSNQRQNVFLSSAIQNALKDLDSNDPFEVVQGLNYFTKTSFDQTDTYNAMQLESHPLIILSFGSLLDTLNPLANLLFPKQSSSREAIDRISRHSKEIPWSAKLPSDTPWQSIREYLGVVEDNAMLLSALNVIRNFSFDMSNEQLLANSTTLLSHLVSIVMTSLLSTSSTLSEFVQLAFDILTNVASRLDTSGKRRLQWSTWMEDTSSPSYNKELLFFRLSFSMSEESSELNQIICKQLMTFLCSAIHQTFSRQLILRSIELITKLAQVPENAAIFRSAPNEFYSFLVELLCVNFTTIDPLSHTSDLNPHDTDFVAIPTAFRIPPYVGGSYFPDIDTYDAEIRDVTLQALLSIAQLAPETQVSIARVPKCLQLLLKVMDMKYAKNGVRSEGMQLALQLLTVLIMNPLNESKFKTVRAELMTMAFADDLVADLVTFTAASIFLSPSKEENGATLAAAAVNSALLASS